MRVSQMLPSSRLDCLFQEFSCFTVFLFYFCLSATFHLSNTKKCVISFKNEVEDEGEGKVTSR